MFLVPFQPGRYAGITRARRAHAANQEFAVGATCHISNGDEENVSDYVGQFHKSLPHDKFGIVDPAAYQKLLDCTFSGNINVCDKVPSGAPKDGRKMVNPLGGTAHQMDGADRWGRDSVCPLSTTMNHRLFKISLIAAASLVLFSD